jgi:uroporphyrinogen decarboxylase
MDEMTSRERMLAAINLEPVDRVPTDIWATPEVLDRLNRLFGSEEAVRESLHIDGMAWVYADYIGPAVDSTREDRQVDMWGVVRKRVSFEAGTYYEPVFNPLAQAESIDDLREYRWPDADWFDYSRMREAAEQARWRQVVRCGSMPPFHQHILLRGRETALTDPLLHPELTHYLLGRLCDFLYEHHRRMFQECEGLIDVSEVTDDLGGQNGPLISMELYREFYAPHHERFIDLCKEFGIKVLHHDDGSMRTFLPDLIEMGIDILNPVQWTCPGMDMVELKREFRNKICFHGAVENQRILPFGKPEEVRAEVRHCIDSLSSDGTGYILASCHNVQPNTPTENIMAMYEEAYSYGNVG